MPEPATEPDSFKDPSLCQIKGCEEKAVCAIKLCVPATGFPAIEKRSAHLMIPVGHCHKHFTEAKASDFLEADPRIKEIISMAALATSRVPPDFKRAFLVWLGFDDPDYKKLMKMQSS